MPQFAIEDDRVFEHSVGIENGHLALGRTETAIPKPFAESGVFELAPMRAEIALTVGKSIASNGGAALVVDYGHRKSAIGETLQAMKNHSYCSIFESPGEADITSHVDFSQLGKAFEKSGVNAFRVLAQGEFLNAMGLQLRTEVLARKVDSVQRSQLQQASRRLSNSDEMGQLFKVFCAAHKDMPMPFPFEAP
jgi:NADH dehydrogenase [ubiquinone] 1 alpha subcomplex assembly factor 7